MLKAKPPTLNIYSYTIKQQRLKIALFLTIICLINVNCAESSRAPQTHVQNSPEISASTVNINTANAKDLEMIPHIGKEYARKIIEHREKFGAFRRTEELLMVRGISDKKFREIRSLIKTE